MAIKGVRYNPMTGKYEYVLDKEELRNGGNASATQRNPAMESSQGGGVTNLSAYSGLGNMAGDLLQSTQSPLGTIGGSALKGAAAGAALGPWGAAVGGVIGAGVGVFQNKKNQEEAEERNKLIIAGQVTGDATKFQQANTRVMAEGGSLNQGATITQYNGPVHEQGGIKLTDDIEVEGGEVRGIGSTKDYIFSDTLKPQGSKKTYADLSKAIEKAFKGMESDRYGNEAKNKKLKDLAEQQEADKSRQFLRKVKKLQQTDPDKFAQLVQSGGLQQAQPTEFEEPEQNDLTESGSGFADQSESHSQRLNTTPIRYELGGLLNQFNEEDLLLADGLYRKGGKIYISPSKRGTFTAAAKKRGKGVQEFARQVLANKEQYSASMVKKAAFAKGIGGAAKKHEFGGLLSNESQSHVEPYQVGNDLFRCGGSTKYALGGYMEGDPTKPKKKLTKTQYNAELERRKQEQFNQWADYLGKLPVEELHALKANPDVLAEKKSVYEKQFPLDKSDIEVMKLSEAKLGDDPIVFSMDDYEDDLAGKYFHPTKSVMTQYRALVDAGEQTKADQLVLGVLNQSKTSGASYDPERHKEFVESGAMIPITAQDLWKLDETKYPEVNDVAKGINYTRPKFKNGGPILHSNENAQNDELFQKWYRKNTLEGQDNIPYSDRLTYDYYSFYKNTGGRPAKGNPADHFPDTYKKPNHPTFSNESLYSTPEKPGGKWDGEQYIQNGQFQKKLKDGGEIDPPGTPSKNKRTRTTVNDLDEISLAKHRALLRQLHTLNPEAKVGDYSAYGFANMLNPKYAKKLLSTGTTSPYAGSDEEIGVYMPLNNENVDFLNTTTGGGEDTYNKLRARVPITEKQFISNPELYQYGMSPNDYDAVSRYLLNKESENVKSTIPLTHQDVLNMTQAEINKEEVPKTHELDVKVLHRLGGPLTFRGTEPYSSDLSEAEEEEENKLSAFKPDYLGSALSAIPNIAMGVGSGILANKLNYGKTKAEIALPDYVDPTRGLQEVKDQFAGVKDVIRQNAGGSGNLMSNLIGATSQESKALSDVSSKYDNMNAGISNQFAMANAENMQRVNSMNAQIGMQQEQDRMSMRENALKNIGAGLNTGMNSYFQSKQDALMMNVAGGENFSYKKDKDGNIVKVFKGNGYEYYDDANTGKRIILGNPNKQSGNPTSNTITDAPTINKEGTIGSENNGAYSNFTNIPWLNAKVPFLNSTTNNTNQLSRGFDINRNKSTNNKSNSSIDQEINNLLSLIKSSRQYSKGWLGDLEDQLAEMSAEDKEYYLSELRQIANNKES